MRSRETSLKVRAAGYRHLPSTLRIVTRYRQAGLGRMAIGSSLIDTKWVAQSWRASAAGRYYLSGSATRFDRHLQEDFVM